MAGTGSDEIAFEQTWQMLELPGGAPALPDETILASRGGPARPLELPPLSVDERGGAAGEAGGADLMVVRALGEGGMGRVQLAVQRSLEREVALKRPRAGASEREAQVLREEGLVAGHLEHPNIVPIHALGLDDGGQPVIVMKRVEGVPWRELLLDDGHPGWASRESWVDARLVWHLQTLVQLCNAIAYAHSRGIVHRDLKPDNVMIGEFGEVYLLDWGAAARVGDLARGQGGRPVLVGTPVYMAPEMMTGGRLDERTDVYLLGATLHEVLTRRVRHPASDLHRVLLSVFLSSPVAYDPEVPAELAELANRATSRDPDRRPESAVAFRQALLEYLRHRASLGMSAMARELLVQVEQAVAAGTIAPTVEATVEECRFGFRQAQRAWPDSPDAARGIERCAAAVVRLEIARGNAGGARTALAQLADPPLELCEALARLESQALAEKAEHIELRRMAKDLDPVPGGLSRAQALMIVLALTIGISTFGIRVEYAGQGLSDGQLLALPVVGLLGVLVTLFFVRRRLLVSGINRRLAAWMVTAVSLAVVSHIVGVSMGLSTARLHVMDLLLLAGMLASGGIFVLRWMWLCSVVVVAGALVGAAVPRIAFVSFAVCLTAVIVIGILFLPSGGESVDPP